MFNKFIHQLAPTGHINVEIEQLVGAQRADTTGPHIHGSPSSYQQRKPSSQLKQQHLWYGAGNAATIHYQATAIAAPTGATRAVNYVKANM